MITIKLNFVTGQEGLFNIDEPDGFDEFSFTLEQESGRYGRDISFADNDITFYKNRNHQFELLLFYHQKYGWESRVELIVDLDGIEEVMGILDFKEATTDQIDFFKCSIIDDDTKSLIKKRDDIETNLFSNKTLDDDDIEPVSEFKMLFKSQPIRQKSTWDSGSLSTGKTSVSDFGGDTEIRFFNPIKELEVFDIDDSFIPFSFKGQDEVDFEVIKATNNLKDVEIKFENTFFEISGDSDGGANGDITYSLVVATALISDGKILRDDLGNLIFEENVIYTKKIGKSGFSFETGDFTFRIPFLTRGRSILIYWKIRTKKTSLLGTIESFMTFGSGMKLNILATSVPFNTVLDSVRLVDAVKYNVKSISGGDVSFPIAEIGGEYYNHFLFTGKSLRNIKDVFNIKFKEIEGFLKEFNGDFQINNGVVLFDTYLGFYSNTEIAKYDDVQFDSYEVNFNKRYTLNKFTYEYTKYFAKREEKAENTSETVHAKASYVILNKQVEDKKEVKVDFIRDPFFIQQQISLAIKESDNTSSDADRDIFIVHAIENNNDFTFSESAELRHSFDELTGNLSLVNDGSFNFSLLGISVGSIFEVLPINSNAGTYTVVETQTTTIILNPVSASPTVVKDGIRETIFKYTVSSDLVPFISASDENIQSVKNKLSGSDFANMEYTVARNVRRFWLSYISTANLYTGKEIKLTEYFHGKDVTIVIDDKSIREGDNLQQNKPVLLPFVHKLTVIKELEEFISLKNALQTTPGFIRFFDNNKTPIRLYPQKITYSLLDKELKIEGEEKAESIYLDINNSSQGFIMINETYISSSIRYKLENNVIFLYDSNGGLLARPTFWNKVSLNGKFAKDINELQSWLMLLS